MRDLRAMGEQRRWDSGSPPQGRANFLGRGGRAFTVTHYADPRGRIKATFEAACFLAG